MLGQNLEYRMRRELSVLVIIERSDFEMHLTADTIKGNNAKQA